MSLQLPKRARNVVFGIAASSALLLLSGCSTATQDEWKRLAEPLAATKEAHHVHDLWIGAWIAAMVTGVVVWGLIFYVVIRYRRRDESDIPVQTRYNLPIEIFYTIAPIMMVIVFFSYTIQTQDEVLHNPKSLAKANAEADATVTVVGQQWSWTFNYTDVDALGGREACEGLLQLTVGRPRWHRDPQFEPRDGIVRHAADEVDVDAERSHFPGHHAECLGGDGSTEDDDRVRRRLLEYREVVAAFDGDVQPDAADRCGDLVA